VSSLGCYVQTNVSQAYTTSSLGNVSQLEENWQKGLESQVSHLSGKLNALCSDMRELHQLLFIDDKDGKRPNFKHDQLGLGY
jgi:hypothetical protein